MRLRDYHALVEADDSSEAFSRWFGGSQAVDGAGKPLKLYHGTSKDADFKHFKVPRNGVWFTSDRASASSYAEENDSRNSRWDHDRRTYVPYNTASRVLPVYLKIDNPKRVASMEALLPPELRHADNYRRAQGIAFDRLRAEGFDSAIIADQVYVLLDLNGAARIKSALSNTKFSAGRNIHEVLSHPSAGAACHADAPGNRRSE